MGAVYDSTVSLVIRAQDEASATLGQVGDVFRALGKTIDAAMAHTPGFDKIGQSAQATARDAAEMDSALGRAGEAARSAGERFSEATGLTDHFHESLARIKDTAVSFTLGSLGFEAFSQAELGVESFGKGLIEANATAEQLTQTMAAIYHSAPEAQQAVAFMTQFALAAPFTRTSIMQAGTTIAALGMDITQVLPALGNLSAVMGTQLPVAAQAFMDAYEGRFQMLQRDLHVSKQQLEAYGLQISATGQIVQSTFAPAFERFVAANYPTAMALQMKTFNGQMSNATDQFQNFERVAGHAIFEKLKTEVGGFLTYLQTHQNEVNVFASTIGDVLGGAMNTLFTGIHAVVDALPGMINLWNNVTSAISGPLSQTLDVASGALGAFWNFFSQMVMPRVGEAITTMIGWWQEHGTAILDDLNVITRDFETWFTWILSHASDFMTAFTGEWQIGWGIISNLFLGTLDLLSGNWAGFGNGMVRLIAEALVGVVNVFGGLLPIVTDLLEKLVGPFNNFLHWLYDANKAIGDAIYTVFGGVEVGVLNLLNGLISKADGLINKVKNASIDALHLPAPLADAMKRSSDVSTAPAIDVSKAMADIKKNLENKNWLAGLFTLGLGTALPSGLAPNKQITFGQTADQAKAAERERAAELIKTITGNYTALTGMKFDQSFNAGAVQGPKVDPMAALLAEWKTMTSGPGLKLDMSKAGGIAKWLGEALTVPKLTGAEDPTVKASKLTSVDRTQFDWDIIRKANHATLETDVAKILKDMGKEPGMTQAGLHIENYNDQQRIKDLYKKDDSAIVARLDMQFNLDKITNASNTKLQTDIAAILGQMKADGATALQINYERATLEQQLTKGLKALQPPKIGSGFQKSVYGYTSRQQVGQGVGLGETLVTFGGRVGKDPAQQMIDKLDAQVHQLTQQNAALTALLSVAEEGRDATMRVGDLLARPPRSTPGAGIGNPLRVQGLATAVR